MGNCRSVKKDGRICRGKAMKNFTFCGAHNPEKRPAPTTQGRGLSKEAFQILKGYTVLTDRQIDVIAEKVSERLLSKLLGLLKVSEINKDSADDYGHS